MKKTILTSTLALMAACAVAQPAAQAQPAPAAAASGPAASPAAASAAKKALIAKVLKLQQSSFEVVARAMVESPAAQMGQQAGIALQQRVPAEQRATVAKEMQADLNAYVADAYPAVRDRAIALGPTTVGKVLDEKFTEAELKQLVAILESPAYRKFSEMGNVLQRALQDKLVQEMKGPVEAKLRLLEKAWGKRLGLDTVSSPDGAASAPAK